MKKVLFVGLIYAACYGNLIAQSIPTNPNRTDSNGLRQGKWTIWYDQYWDITTDKKNLEFFRIIEYKDDKPVGVTTDYYKNGVKQMEAHLIADRPKDVFNYNHPIRYFEPDGSEDVSGGMNEFAVHYHNVGDYAKAEPLYLEALKIRKRTLGVDHSDYALILDNLGDLYVDIGNYGKAEQLILESIRINKDLLRNEHPDHAFSLNNLANLYKEMGEYGKAEPLFLEAIEIIKKTLGTDNMDYAMYLNNLGLLYLNMGNYAKAEPLLLESVLITKRIVGAEHPDYAYVLESLARLYHLIGSYTKAESLHLQALQIQKKVLGERHPDYISTLNNLANTYMVTSENSKAEDLLLEGKMILEDIGEKETFRYANTINSLGVFYSMNKQHIKAEPLKWEALRIFKKILGTNHPGYGIALANLAGSFQQTGKLKEAEPLYLECVELKQREIANIFPYLSESEKQTYYQENAYLYSYFESFCMDRYTANPSVLSALFNLRLATKGLLFQSSNGIRNAIFSSGNKDLIASYDEWRLKRDYLARVYRMTLADKQRKGIDEQMLEEEANALEKKLSSQSQLFTTSNVRSYTWETVKQNLRGGEVAIEILRIGGNYSFLVKPQYVALLITPSTVNNPEIIVLSEGDLIEGRMTKYYRNAINQKFDFSTLEGGEDLFKLFWKPIADKISGFKKVHISLDGVYNQINLSTLFNPVTRKYLLDELEIHLVTSTRDLIDRNSKEIASINNVALFGYPNYNQFIKKSKGITSADKSITFSAREVGVNSGQRFFDGGNINELPGTKEEVRSIELLFKAKSIRYTEYLYDSASEESIKKLNAPHVLHFATHGFFLADLPKGDLARGGFMNIDETTFLKNPLLRSGLLFAGAKEAFVGKTVSEGEDGVLTAYEAMNLDLSKTDLVVMSACETGLGVSANGEGVYGLQRSFQVAGAKSVLMSLWSVDDMATQQLMTLFYKYWLEGKPKGEALVSAQRKLREQFPSPFYWGAFVMVGG